MHAFLDDGKFFDGDGEALAAGRDHLLHQHLRRRRAGRDAEAADSFQPTPVDVGRPPHQPCPVAAGALGHLDQPHGIGGVGRAHDQHGIAFGRDRLHGLLAIGGGVADVLAPRPMDLREAPLQHGDHGGGLVDGQGRLRDVGDAAALRQLQHLGIGRRLDERHRAGRQLPHGADHLGMAGVADEHDVATGGVVAFGLAVHLADQRAGRIERDQLPLIGLDRHRLRHAMGGEHDGCAGRHLIELVHEHRALGLQAFDHEAVVNDLVAHIDGRAVPLERAFDDLDGALDAGAETAGRSQEQGDGRVDHRCVLI